MAADRLAMPAASWTAAVELPEGQALTFRCYFPAETVNEVVYPRLTAAQGTQLVTR